MGASLLPPPRVWGTQAAASPPCSAEGSSFGEHPRSGFRSGAWGWNVLHKSLHPRADHELNLTRQGLAPLLVTFAGVIIWKSPKLPIHWHHRHLCTPRLPPLCLLTCFTFLPHTPHSSPVYPIPTPVYLKSTWICDSTTGYIYHSVLCIFIYLISDLKSWLWIFYLRAHSELSAITPLDGHNSFDHLYLESTHLASPAPPLPTKPYNFRIHKPNNSIADIFTQSSFLWSNTV